MSQVLNIGNGALVCSCGSVIAEVALTFKRLVNVQSVISALKAAARNGSLGDLTVDPDSIVQTPKPSTPPSTTTPATTPTESSKREFIPVSDNINHDLI